MLERLEQQKKLTLNQLRIILTANLGDMLDFFDFFLIGYVLGAISGAYLAPVIGWRGLCLVGLSPALLVLMIRYWVPESPRYLMRMGRYEEARRSLAWALQCDPNEIALPTTVQEEEKTRW